MLKNAATIGAVLGWVGLIAIGTTISATYESKPGDPGFAPQTLLSKQDVSPANLSKAKYHLVMFAHPKCPCTRASMHELRNLLDKFPALSATVFFYRPSTETDDWIKSENWKIAKSIKQVTVKTDEDGKKAKSYRIVTSGQVLLYDESGDLVFSGGITAARGHVGDSIGQNMIEDLVTKRNGTQQRQVNFSAPVFGCRILKDNTELCSSVKR